MIEKNIKYLLNQAKEEMAASRIRRYRAITGEPVAVPLPIVKVVGRVLGRDFGWVEIEDGTVFLVPPGRCGRHLHDVESVPSMPVRCIASSPGARP